MAPAPHGSLPPRLWLDNVDALLNEPVYKSVMYQRLESCSSEQELVLLEVWISICAESTHPIAMIVCRSAFSFSPTHAANLPFGVRCSSRDLHVPI